MASEEAYGFKRRLPSIPDMQGHASYISHIRRVFAGARVRSGALWVNKRHRYDEGKGSVIAEI